jgi:protease-4
MRRSLRIFLIVVILLGVFIIGFSCDELTSGSTKYTGDRIGLIHIEGVITAAHADMDPFMMSSPASSDTVVKQFDEAIKDTKVKAIVMRVNSPGGSAAASQEIYNAIRKFQATGRKVYVSMGDVAASGGYYVSAPADMIYADPATLTGSIGVIMSVLNYEGLFDKIGLDEVTIKSGKYKDIGNPNRAMTEEEKRILQNILTEVHKQFKQAVADGRKMKPEQVEKLATGEIWTGSQAKEIGLIDEIGGFKDVLDKAAQDSGLNVKDYVVSPLGEGSILDQILEGFKVKVNPVIQVNGPTSTPSGLFFNPMLYKMTMM